MSWQSMKMSLQQAFSNPIDFILNCKTVRADHQHFYTSKAKTNLEIAGNYFAIVDVEKENVAILVRESEKLVFVIESD